MALWLPSRFDVAVTDNRLLEREPHYLAHNADGILDILKVVILGEDFFRLGTQRTRVGMRNGGDAKHAFHISHGGKGWLLLTRDADDVAASIAVGHG